MSDDGWAEDYPGQRWNTSHFPFLIVFGLVLVLFYCVGCLFALKSYLDFAKQAEEAKKSQ